MANRVASGKVHIPKAFLSAASENTMERVSNIADKQDAVKNSTLDGAIGSDNVERNGMKNDETRGSESDKDCENANVIVGKVCESDAAFWQL